MVHIAARKLPNGRFVIVIGSKKVHMVFPWPLQESEAVQVAEKYPEMRFGLVREVFLAPIMRLHLSSWCNLLDGRIHLETAQRRSG